MLKESRIASSEYSPSNPVEIQYSCGFSAYHLPKNRAYVLNFGDGFTSASSPTRSLTLGRWGCGERTIQSLSWQRLRLVNQRRYARHISLSCHLCLQELE